MGNNVYDVNVLIFQCNISNSLVLGLRDAFVEHQELLRKFALRSQGHLRRGDDKM